MLYYNNEDNNFIMINITHASKSAIKMVSGAQIGFFYTGLIK